MDGLAAVFVREGPGAQRRVDRASVERPAPEAPPLEALPGLGGPARTAPLMRWLSGLVSPRRYPMEEVNLGVFRFYRGEQDQAEAWLRAAIASGGADYYDIYLNLGAPLFYQKKFDAAAACCEVVLQDDPGTRTARGRLDALRNAGR